MITNCFTVSRNGRVSQGIALNKGNVSGSQEFIQFCYFKAVYYPHDSLRAFKEVDFRASQSKRLLVASVGRGHLWEGLTASEREASPYPPCWIFKIPKSGGKDFGNAEMTVIAIMQDYLLISIPIEVGEILIGEKTYTCKEGVWTRELPATAE